jgi:hypothetical protein
MTFADSPLRIEECMITAEDPMGVTVTFKPEDGPEWAQGTMHLSWNLAQGGAKGDKGILKYIEDLNYGVWVFQRRAFAKNGRKYRM